MIEHRLVLERKDGSIEVKGYRRFIGGMVYYRKPDTHWTNYPENVIKGYNRIDRYTGVEVDGVKVFERDKIQYEGINTKGEQETFTRIVLDPFRLYGDTLEHISWLDLRNMINLYGIEVKIIGIGG